MYGKRRCPICRKIFTAGDATTKYCSDACRKKANAKQSQKWKRKNKSYIRTWRKEHPDYQKEYRARKALEREASANV